ncbi:OTU domain-containing protein 1 [Canis lupus dingo]|uniref:OTU domain-containing protein 1 n=1 Tax=Canis lupus dingo TaxID=286419 RepID=A0A8C0LPE5_CANLU|nr:OTU domain-containing protein 1 [Canis lupus dingo]XP_025319733.3 OTU domain-containing protein 1 [Canis lupus dingo]XP_025319734.3 OTU domain-containing protein 1 [Canis lupus dingo]XP_035569810.2 OTU domain-containing protein 1 [Canis lupus dingo]
MQLYSSVCTHYPAGAPGPTAAASAAPAAAAAAAPFKVSLQPPGAASGEPEPETGECQPAAAAEPREAAAAAAAAPAAKMPAFSSCFEVVPGAAAPASAAAGPPAGSCKPPLPPHYTSTAQITVRALGADRLLLHGPEPGAPAPAAPRGRCLLLAPAPGAPLPPRRGSSAWLLEELLRPDCPEPAGLDAAREGPDRNFRLSEHRQALAAAKHRGPAPPPGSPEPGPGPGPGPGPWGDEHPADRSLRGWERAGERSDPAGADEARRPDPEAQAAPAAPARSCEAAPGGAAEAVVVSRSDPRDEKLALYLAEVERQDKYLRQRSKYRFHIIPDGNCLYRAVSKTVYGDQSLHRELREQTVHYIADHLDHFSPLIEGDVGEFIIAAAQDGAWAGYPELLAMGQMLNVNIHLTTGGRLESPTVSTMIHYLGPEDSLRPSIWLSWLSNGHYDAVFDHSYPNPEYDNWCRQTQVQRKRDEELAKSMAISLSKMYIEQNACS